MAARASQQYSAYYSPHHRDAWPSLNYTRGRKYAKSSSAVPLDSYATRNPRRSPCPSMAMLPEPKDYEVLCKWGRVEMRVALLVGKLEKSPLVTIVGVWSLSLSHPVTSLPASVIIHAHERTTLPVQWLLRLEQLFAQPCLKQAWPGEGSLERARWCTLCFSGPSRSSANGSHARVNPCGHPNSVLSPPRTAISPEVYALWPHTS